MFALLVALSPVAAASAQVPAAPTREESLVITSGEGIVRAVPDRAFVSISAESRASSPREAQRRNTEAMKPVQDKLRAAGIPADAIRTTVYDLQFEYDWVGNRRVPKGYVARNTIEVRVDDIDKLGDLLDVAVGAGATSVSDIRFDLKDRGKLEREAVRLAVAEARSRAEAAAAGAGRSIDRVLRIEEHGIIPPPVPVRAMRMEMAQAAEPDTTPISAGQVEVRSRVTLTSVLK
jgi:uncharacterized protein YggE